MNETTSEPDRMLVVTATEWRNLCARRVIRMWTERQVTCSGTPTADQVSRAFAAAPTTKLDSASDLLVLLLRDRTSVSPGRHPDHEMVGHLRLSEVAEHHVLSDDVFAYYEAEGAKSGVHVQRGRFEPSWRHWVLMESARDAIFGAGVLRALAAGGAGANDPGATSMDPDGLLLARRALGDRSVLSGTLLADLLSGSLEIDDAAAATRGTEAYFLVSVLEWVERATGINCWDRPAVGAVVREAVVAAKAHGWDAPHRLTDRTRAALDLMVAAAPHAFEAGLPPIAVAGIVRLRATAKEGGGDPGFAVTVVRAMAADGEPSGGFSVVAASLLGLERIAHLSPVRS